MADSKMARLARREFLWGSGAAMVQLGPAHQAERLVQGWMREQKIPGAAVAVWRRGARVWSGVYGESDVENRVAVSAATKFRIGSLSKLLTAAAAARLYEQGRLDLDAPVERYVPRFPDKGQPITARLLLGHLAGIRHYGRDEYLNRRRYENVADTLAVFEDSPLLHEPGTKYAYSSYGFNLLGAVLEGASGGSFLTCVRQQVLDPIGMRSTMADEHDRIIVNRGRYYSLANGEVTNSPDTDLSDRWPSGGFLSTAEDLALFGSAHLAGNFLKPRMREMMFTSQRTASGTETGVGLGWRIGVVEGKKVFHHGGDAVGGRAFLLLRPDEEMVVAWVSNLTFSRIGEKEVMAIAQCFEMG